MNYTARKINDEIDLIMEQRRRGEITDAETETALDTLYMKLGQKLENIGYVRIEKKAYIKRLKAEKKRIDREIHAVTEDVKWLDLYCMAEMVRAGLRKFQGNFIKIAISKSQNSAEVPIDPDTKKPQWDLIDSRFVGETVEPKLLKQEALDHYERTGEVPEGFTIITDREHLRVKAPHSEPDPETEE